MARAAAGMLRRRCAPTGPAWASCMYRIAQSIGLGVSLIVCSSRSLTACWTSCKPVASWLRHSVKEVCIRSRANIHKDSHKMPRYFFRLEHPDGDLCDDIGEQFETVQVASVFATHVARELSRNRPQHAAIGSQLLVVAASPCFSSQ